MFYVNNILFNIKNIKFIQLKFFLKNTLLIYNTKY